MWHWWIILKMTNNEDNAKSSEVVKTTRWRKFLCWGEVILWMSLIFIGSTDLLSGTNTARFLRPILRFVMPFASEKTIYKAQYYIRKGGHVTEYAILAVLLRRAVSLHPAVSSPRLAFAVAMALAAIYASSDEIHQTFYKSRTGSPVDVFIDSSGAFIGLMVFRPWWRKNKPVSG